MAGMGIDGLASGLDTTALIKQLMQVEAMPQTLLKAKSTQAQTFVTGLRALNTRVASLTEAATKATKPDSWAAVRATSSSDAAAAVTSTSAQPGTLTFTVEKVAAAQVTLTAAYPDNNTLVPAIPPAVTIKKHDGTLVTVHPTSGSLSDVARAVNEAADSGIKATVVRVSGGATPQYRLQFTGTATGTDGDFAVYAGTDATGPRIDTGVAVAASDAELTLWKGSPSQQTFTQSSNTFVGLMTGVDVTVSAVTGAGDDPVTVSVARDDAALSALASGLVGAMGVVLSEITSRTATVTKANEDGTTTITGGIFSADSAVRGIQQQLMTAMSMPVDDVSPSEVGIVLAKDGTFTFDEKKFAAALAADPVRTQAIVAGIAERVAEVGTNVSDKYDGSLTRKITGQEKMVRDLGTQIESWDRRLEVRREGLQRTYSALEVALSNLQSQSSWLTSQLANLPTYS